ncbi:MAG: SLBB domain-containing protein, partial [Caulobacter sp.]|nr:SLBB domain-containing protein [Vitreoscilla sp.]
MLNPRSPALPAALRSGSAMLLALAIALASAPAAAQFSGDAANTDLSRINDATGTASAPSEVTSTPQLRQAPRSTRADGDQPESRGLPYRAQNYQPSEFELYVQQQTSGQTAQLQDENGVAQGQRRPVRRFGANLVTDDATASASQDPLPSVPGDYVVRPGDEINLTIWGSVDADLQATVDRAGRINVPRVGAITVAGVRNADLVDVISRRVGQTFRNFQLAVTLGQVRPIRVFVGGYVQHPGSITVNGLSSVLHALMRAGGPAAAGSFRDIHLRRGGKEMASFDLYDLLLKGDRGSDQLVQPDDILFVGPIGTQVAVLGSVNQPAIYELKPGETLDDVLRMAGSFTAVGDRSRVSIERLSDRATGKVAQLTLPAHQHDALATGDVIRAFSAVAVALPQDRQNEHVRIEGEVLRPGDYILPPGSRVEDALRAAGGFTSSAYPFGTEFTRESVRRVQVVNYERALRDFETDMAKTQANQRATSTEEINAQASSAQSNARLLERLHQTQPTGRDVHPMAPDATGLPNMALQDGDTLTIPQRGT